MITNGTNTSDRYVKWDVEWFWTNINGAISATDTQLYEYKIPANTTSKTQLLVSISSFVPTGAKIGGHVYARLKRITATGLAPTNNPWCTMLQMHAKCDSLGSRSMGLNNS